MVSFRFTAWIGCVSVPNTRYASPFVLFSLYPTRGPRLSPVDLSLPIQRNRILSFFVLFRTSETSFSSWSAEQRRRKPLSCLMIIDLSVHSSTISGRPDGGLPFIWRISNFSYFIQTFPHQKPKFSSRLSARLNSGSPNMAAINFS